MPIFYIRDKIYTEDQIAKLKQTEQLLFNLSTMPKSLFKYYLAL